MTVDEVRTRLLAYLPEPYNVEVGSNNYGIMTGYAEEINLSYVQNDFLHEQVGVNTAEGAYLDDIGLLFRLQREVGETDDQFRSRIKSYFVSFSGGGTSAAITTAVSRVTGLPEENITITDIIPLKFMVTFVVSELGPVIGTVKKVVNEAKAAGTYAYFTAQTKVAAEGMSFSEMLSFMPEPGIIVSAYDIGSTSVI